MIIMENLETNYTGVLNTTKGYNAHYNYRVNLGNYLTEKEASQAVYNYIIDNITECEISKDITFHPDIQKLNFII